MSEHAPNPDQQQAGYGQEFNTVMDNPNIEKSTFFDPEGGVWDTVEDDNGNKITRGDNYGIVPDLDSAVYHVEGGAANGGKTYEARNKYYGADEQGSEVDVITSTGERKTIEQSGILARKIIQMAAKNIDRNSASAATSESPKKAA